MFSSDSAVKATSSGRWALRDEIAQCRSPLLQDYKDFVRHMANSRKPALAIAALNGLFLLALPSGVNAEPQQTDANQARENCLLAKERQNELAMKHWCATGAQTTTNGKAVPSRHGPQKQSPGGNAVNSVKVGGGEASRPPVTSNVGR